jgi:hypothetical protein
MLTAPRLAALSALTAAGLAVASPAALAAPSNGPTFDVTCPGLGSFQVVSPAGNGDFTPVFRAGTHGAFIPYQIHGTVTSGGQVVDRFDDVKAAPVPSSAMTCTFAATFTEEGMTIHVAGTAVVVFRGA